jgi:hypothetical protein
MLLCTTVCIEHISLFLQHLLLLSVFGIDLAPDLA